MALLDPFAGIIGFEWDEANSEKNWRSHAVTRAGAEQAFANPPVLVVGDVAHSQDESRFVLLGRTDGNRRLFVAFMVRRNRVRIISARPMSRRERRQYGEALGTQA